MTLRANELGCLNQALQPRTTFVSNMPGSFADLTNKCIEHASDKPSSSEHERQTEKNSKIVTRVECNKTISSSLMYRTNKQEHLSLENFLTTLKNVKSLQRTNILAYCVQNK